MEVLREERRRMKMPPADTTILDLLAANDESALPLLISTYTRYVSSIIHGVGHAQLCAEDMEELAADSFTAIWQNRQRITGPIKPYLAQIARNKTISFLRSNKGSNLSLDDEVCQLVTTQSTEEQADLQEQYDILNRLIAAMGEPAREIFLRFYYLGEKIDAIASALHLPASTVKTKLRRSRIQLRKELEERGYRYED